MTLTLHTFTSFDHLSVADLSLMSAWTGTAAAIVAGYDGGLGAVNGPVTLADAITASTYAGVDVFLRFKPADLASEQLIMAVRTSTTDHVGLWLTTGGYLKLATGPGSAAGPWTSAAHDPLVAGTWYGLEMGVYVDDAIGQTKVLLDGLPVSDLEQSDVDTNGHASSWLPTQITLSNASATYDDYVSLIGTAAPGASDYRSDLVGNPRIATLWPVLSGAYVEWTPSDAVDHYTLIDEVRADNLGTQLSTVQINARESWRIQALPDDLDSIEAVDTVYYVRNKIAGEKVTHFWRIANANYSHPDAPVALPSGGAWTVESVRWDASPATEAAWTASELEAAEAGIIRSSAGFGDGTAISQGVVTALYYVSEANVLTVDPEYPIAAWISRRAVMTPADSGYVQRRQVQSSVSRQSGKQSVRSWQLEWRHLTPAEKAAIADLYDAAIGGSFAIKVQPAPTSPLVEVRFVESSLLTIHVTGQWHSARILVEEVI